MSNRNEGLDTVSSVTIIADVYFVSNRNLSSTTGSFFGIIADVYFVSNRNYNVLIDW